MTSICLYQKQKSSCEPISTKTPRRTSPTRNKPTKRKSLMSIENKPNEQQTGADIVVKTLEQQNVKWVFGVPGAKIDKVFNTLVDSSIQTVVCRHEQNAAF